MKNIILILISFFIFVSCVTEAAEIDRQYQILNNSGINIKLKFFNTFSDKSFIVGVAENEIYKAGLLTYRSGNPQISEADSFYPSGAYRDSNASIIISDSVVVVFDNNKFLSANFKNITPTEAIFSNPTDRNLFRHGSYQELKNEVFQFEITQQDYENAQLCNGNCD